MSNRKNTYGNVRIVAEHRGYKSVDYYLLFPDQRKEYAFTRNYTNRTLDICKSGIRVEDLLHRKSRDKSVMFLVKYVEHIMPYLMDYYGNAA